MIIQLIINHEYRLLQLYVKYAHDVDDDIEINQENIVKAHRIYIEEQSGNLDEIFIFLFSFN